MQIVRVIWPVGAGGVFKGKRFRFQNVLLSDKINGIRNADVREEWKHWSEHRLASSVQKETLIFLCAEEQRVTVTAASASPKQRDVQYCDCRSQWPHRLRHELSLPSQSPGSWVRIPLEVWMSVCVYSVFLLSCMQVAALRRADPPSKESYRLCQRSRNWKSGHSLIKGCTAIERIT
jgi:hypothetical protein